MSEILPARPACQDEQLAEALRRSPLFRDLPQPAMERLLAATIRRELPAGTVLVTEGEPATSAYLVLDGELEVLRRAGNQEIAVAVRAAGEVIGEMSLLTGASRSASVRARTFAVLAEIPRSALESTAICSPSALLAVLGTVVERLRDNEAHLVQHQKMAALGTIAAGLAHELNNPAAAVRRASSQLAGAVADWERAAFRLGSSHPGTVDSERLDVLRDELAARAVQLIWLDPLARDVREQAVGDWLASSGADGSGDPVAALVDAGWDSAALEEALQTIPPAAVPAVLDWVAAGQSVQRLLHELVAGTQAISGIVANIREYTRLDQTPVHETDVHVGIDRSLALLRHKLAGVMVERDYAADVPLLRANAVELNQVWTNLIDNAADALAGSGRLALRTRREPGAIVVVIEDDGPGIAPETRERLFEPFFTTKAPGKGVGLGLSISWSIARRHHGDITVDSRPGRTAFTVRLPLGEQEETA
jgi:signal transduction histidine kinase